MRDFKKLKVWEKAHNLTLAVYKTSSSFPEEEKYGLRSQVRRSCASIPCNIAEGCGRSSKAELAHFMNIGFGSASELEYELLLARDLGFVSIQNYEKLSNEVIEIKRMLASYMQELKPRQSAES